MKVQHFDGEHPRQAGYELLVDIFLRLPCADIVLHQIFFRDERGQELDHAECRQQARYPQAAVPPGQQKGIEEESRPGLDQARKLLREEVHTFGDIFFAEDCEPALAVRAQGPLQVSGVQGAFQVVCPALAAGRP